MDKKSNKSTENKINKLFEQAIMTPPEFFNIVETPEPINESKCVNCGMREISSEVAGVHTGVMATTYACGTKIIGQLLETTEVCDEITSLKNKISSWNKLTNITFSNAVQDIRESLTLLSKTGKQGKKKAKDGREALNAIIQHEGRLRHHADVNNRQVF
ncbi:hypothetical protein [Spartinivicinus poritis]|uniref:Uncharacterized protein n=1 Tax=Spartinivicinus poritis TaxID=2994640 RepID=A0ABT5UEM6_9GAMM|nr:hypothetical protein [Spartinivicinus sp. A2-2]MDE1464813.1 hypothetical protein [Spartinivicinus sp. A2-2]